MTGVRLVYDDECGFCTRSALFVARHADLELVPFSEVDEELAGRLPAEWHTCAHLLVDGTVYSCGEAMERAYELTGQPFAGVPPYLRRVPGYDRVREAGYRLVADNRPLVSRLMRRFW